jgi:ORF6N domain
MFELNRDEHSILRSQIVTSRLGQWGRTRYKPMAFTEQGVAMLSSILRIKRAIQVNIAIMRVFARLREMMATHKELAYKLKEQEERLEGHDEQIQNIFAAIRQLMKPLEPPRRRIGFEAEATAGPYGKGKGGCESRSVTGTYDRTHLPQARMDTVINEITTAVAA